MRPYAPPPCIQNKDPNQFVYNSSVNKGMLALFNEIWPEVKRAIPEAKLTVIGGYYQGAGKNGVMDEQEQAYHALRGKWDGKLGITFTGIITQEEIARILSKATFMIYPPAFPETFGISTLEALYYNVVPITSRFGALEQTAIEEMSYLMDYRIMENDQEQQTRFVELVKMAHANTYLTKQKQNKCTAIRDWVSWETVALQWKAHFFRKTGKMMTREETEKTRAISSNVNRLFNTRHINPEDRIEFFPDKNEKRLVVISPVRNAAAYIGQCINSVASQLYTHYIHYIIDDHSTDGTATVAANAIRSLPESVREKFSLIQNIESVGALANQILAIGEVATEGDIVLLLDGDDWLYNDPDIFSYVNSLYYKYEMTYGSCWSLADNIPLIAQEYPEEIKRSKSFRDFKFDWGIPYTHLRTFSYELFMKIDGQLLTDPVTGLPYRAGGDGALMYALLEACDSDKIGCVQRLLVNYNDLNPLNDYKVNHEEQNLNRDAITKLRSIEELASVYEGAKNHDPEATKKTEKKILIGIPTAKYIEPQTFKSLYELHTPEGYRTDFQYFYGYNIAQIRNLMADYTIRNNYDYLLSVDSDIVMPMDALVKLHRHNKDCVGGIYIQRKPEKTIPEVFLGDVTTSICNADMKDILEPKLMPVAAIGFGCMLISRGLFEKIGYPQFEYRNSLDHQKTLSEDVDFCIKARRAGIQVFADTSIRCQHIGNFTYQIND
jgi:glycosyltransferase involved in cell wall biosynthesis